MKARNLVIFAVVLCLALAGHKLYNVYREHMPVAKQGECLHVSDGKVEATILVIQNDNTAGASLVVSYNNGAIVEFSYAEMRDLDAKVVECPK